MQEQERVERMKASIPQRRFVETTESFCELITDGYPVRQAVQDVLDAGAPYTHLPYHVSVQKGRPHKISNDHCLLDTRAALSLAKHMPTGMELLPLVQSVWYWPQGIDVWGQTKLEGWSGDTTDTVLALINLLKAQGHNRYPTPQDWAVYPHATQHYSTAVEPIVEGCAEVRLEAFREAVMMCWQDEAYGLFLGLAAEPSMRRRLENELLYVGLTDVQERVRQGHLKTLQHTTLRARAAIDLANYVGWEQAGSIFQATIPDLAMGPRYFSLHDHVSTLCDEAFGDRLGELKATNTLPVSAEETKELIDLICGDDAWAVSSRITQFLQEGKAVQQIADAITVAAARVVTLAEQNGSNPIIWVHSVDYCNVVNTWLRDYDHPQHPLGLYLMALVTHYAVPAFPVPAFTDSVELKIDRGALPGHLTPTELTERLSEAIEHLDVQAALQAADAYVRSGAEAGQLMSALALATSKTQDNPHHHKIVCTALEEYEQSTSPLKHELLLMASAYLGAARSMRDCYELYTSYFPTAA